MTPATKKGIVMASIAAGGLIMGANMFLVCAGYPPQWLGSILGLLAGLFIGRLLCWWHVLE